MTRMKPTLQRLSDHLSLYLPVLLMGALALGSWWLVRTAPQPERSPHAAPPPDMPDYSLERFTTNEFGPQGQWRNALSGASARHYPTDDRLEIDAVRARSLGRNGSLTTLSAQRGQSDGSGSEVQLWGQAQVQRYDRPEASTGPADFVLESEFLHAWPDLEVVRTHLPTVVRQGSTTLRGNSLEYDHLNQVLQLRGRVQGQWQPPR